ncbi:unnamed protein product, partial [Didymodactylos carnosus]
MSRSRIQRNRTQATRFTPTQIRNPLPENYLLRFEDNDELIVAKRTSVKSIKDDTAVLRTGRNRRTAIIEAKGSYSQCNAMYEQMIKQDEEDEQQGDEQKILKNEYGDSNDENLSNEEMTVYNSSFFLGQKLCFTLGFVFLGSKSPTQKRKRALVTINNGDGDSGEDNAAPIQAITPLRNT